MTHPERLLDFVSAMTRVCNERIADESQLLMRVKPLMHGLVAQDDWLPDAMAVPHPQYYQQHLLYGDPLDRFSLVSFVWGPGQKTPVHDHTVWGIIGMLRGAECSQNYTRGSDAEPLLAAGPEARLEPGDLAMVSPSLGDIHQVRNALDDQVSISIHLYGGNIGRIARHVFAPDTGVSKAFVSGYSNLLVPNLWPAPSA